MTKDQLLIAALDKCGGVQRKLARELDMDPSSINGLLRGRRNLGLEVALRIADFVGADRRQVIRHYTLLGEVRP